MRILCIESFNKEYNLNNSLKKKLKGRNRDIHVSDMTNYQTMKQELSKNQTKLEIVNKKSLELDNNSKEVKNIVDNLKTTIINKDKYVLKQEDKDKLITFIDKVDKTNNEYKNIQTLSVTLNNVHEELKENREKIKVLTENNNALSLRVETLTKNLKSKTKEIKELEEENYSLREKLEFWKDKFLSVINLISDKLFDRGKVRDKYRDVSIDLYSKGIISDETFEDLKDTYVFSKEHDSKEKDDFER